MNYFEDLADAHADYCVNNHTDRPDQDCHGCEARKELQHCGSCGADFVDGKWWTALGSTAPNGCDHETLVDDWTNPVQCESLTYRAGVGAYLPCRRDVYRAGATQCDDHLVAADYQRMVARAS